MTFQNGDFTLRYAIQVVGTNRFQVPEPDVRVPFFEHQMRNGIWQAEFTFENNDSRMRIERIGQFVRTGNLIKFSYGYIDDLSPEYIYRMDKIDGLDQIKVTAFPDIPGLMTPRSRTFEKKETISDVVKKMAEEMDLSTDLITKTTCPVDNLKQNNESNAKFILRLGEELHFEVGFFPRTSTEKGQLLFRPRGYDAKPTFWFGNRIGSFFGDIVEFTPKRSNHQMPTEIEQISIDRAKGNTNKIQATSKDADNYLVEQGFSAAGPSDAGEKNQKVESNVSQTGPVTTFNISTGEDLEDQIEQNSGQGRSKPTGGRNGRYRPINKSKPKDKEKDKCKADDKFKILEDSVMNADMTLAGQPLMINQIVIKLVGLDVQYDGNWYVDEVRHEIGLYGYLTNSVLARNSFPDVAFGKTPLDANFIAQNLQDVKGDPGAISKRNKDRPANLPLIERRVESILLPGFSDIQQVISVLG